MGLLKNLRENFNPTPVALSTLRPDLQDCVQDLHPDDARTLLAWYGKYGEAIGEVSTSEPFAAAIPALALKGRGLLVLTSDRLLFSGEFGHLEVPLHRLSVSSLGLDRHELTLSVGVSPNNDPVHEFGVSTLKQKSRHHFVGVLAQVVREAEDSKHPWSGVAVGTISGRRACEVRQPAGPGRPQRGRVSSQEGAAPLLNRPRELVDDR